MRLTGKRGSRTVATKSAALRRDCTYTIRASVRTKGALRLTVRFLGNSVLKGKNSPTRNARAG